MNKEKTQPVQTDTAAKPVDKQPKAPPEEFGGQKGPEPTRYGDWEQKGRVSDF